MNVLVFNCGSSSIKYQLFAMPHGAVLAKGAVSRIGEETGELSQTTDTARIEERRPVADHRVGCEEIKRMLTDERRGPLDSFDEIGACGHRVVHGGEKFTGSVLIDDAVIAAIEAMAELAPLHNPPNLVGIRAAMAMAPGIPQVAVFDTAFHQSVPREAFLYGLPYEMYEKHRVRRYGFHGTSHRWVTTEAAKLLGRSVETVSLITAHLGNGCSLTAVRNGRSVDTSLGLTPVAGVMMGTRTGDVDPGVIFHLQRKGFGADELDRLFNKQSGLLGISGESNDVRDLETLADQGNERARLALEMFAYRVKQYIGNYLAVLNGCQAIVFTGGIGENGPRMRERIAGELDALGIVLDPSKNDPLRGEAGVISADDSRIGVLVVPTNEEASIATDTFELAAT